MNINGMLCAVVSGSESKESEFELWPLAFMHFRCWLLDFLIILFKNSNTDLTFFNFNFHSWSQLQITITKYNHGRRHDGATGDEYLSPSNINRDAKLKPDESTISVYNQLTFDPQASRNVFRFTNTGNRKLKHVFTVRPIRQIRKTDNRINGKYQYGPRFSVFLLTEAQNH